MSQDELKLNLLRQLSNNPELSQRQLADELGVSLGSINYCLRALADVGSIKMSNFARSQDKRAYVYLLTPKGVAEKTAMTLRFLKRKQNEYDALKVEIDLLRAEVEQFGAL